LQNLNQIAEVSSLPPPTTCTFTVNHELDVCYEP